MQNMQLTREQVNVAIAAGLALTNPEDDKIYVPMKHCAGTLVLRSLLMSMANGTIGLSSTMQEAAPPEGGDKEAATEPPKEPAGKTPPAPKTPKKKTSRKKRVAAKKK